MKETVDVLSPAEEPVEEIRAVRRPLFGIVGDDYARLREIGNAIPPGFRRLTGVRPLTPLGEQIAGGGAGPDPSCRPARAKNPRLPVPGALPGAPRCPP